jgi:hypothetical protein
MNSDVGCICEKEALYVFPLMFKKSIPPATHNGITQHRHHSTIASQNIVVEGEERNRMSG